MTDWFPLRDRVPGTILGRDSNDPPGRFYMGTRTGEHRPPRAGEWYLSGAIPEGYRAPTDLTQSFDILRIAKVERVATIVEVEGSSRRDGV